MDINKIIDILDTISVDQSEYEFENFFLDTFPTSSRQLIAVMLEIENLYSQQLTIQATIEVCEEPGEIIRLSRSMQKVRKKYDQLVAWFQSIDPSEVLRIANEFDSQESDYWANHLGRAAAIELLTLGKTSKDTMDKMASLPVDAFEASVKICVRYADLIKQTTEGAEKSLGLIQGQDPQGLPRN